MGAGASQDQRRREALGLGPPPPISSKSNRFGQQAPSPINPSNSNRVALHRAAIQEAGGPGILDGVQFSGAGLFGSGSSSSGVNPFTPPAFGSLLQGTGTNISLPENLTIENSFNPQDINSLRNFATDLNASPWLKLQQENITEQSQELSDQLASRRLGSLTTARENLAARRGLTSGAGERLEQRGIEATQSELQRVGRETGRQRRVAELAERESKLSVLKGLPQLGLAQSGRSADIQRLNISNVLQEKANERNAALETFRIQSGAEAARQQSQATTTAAENPPGLFGGGGFLGTGLFK